MRGGKGGGSKVLHDLELSALGGLGVGVSVGDSDPVSGGIWTAPTPLPGNRGLSPRSGVLGGMGGASLDL